MYKVKVLVSPNVGLVQLFIKFMISYFITYAYQVVDK